ncbi:hypothetical protein [Paenibacillus gorillae]|uniref:hypothetical protein n=1 Tax=Paenibacillus gorillae TaxID=1243662 RepID=UPI0005A5ED95|nr:hypothetical protein [Paenibacillus gorillae]
MLKHTWICSLNKRFFNKKVLVKLNKGVYNDHKMKAVYMLAFATNMEPIPDKHENDGSGDDFVKFESNMESIPDLTPNHLWNRYHINSNKYGIGSRWLGKEILND